MPNARVALVIGNASYKHAPSLDKPIADVRAIAAAFKKLEFDVTKVENATLAQFKDAFRSFRERSATADLAAVYYAGHGIEVMGKNYLVPVDAQLKNPKTVHDIEDEVYALDRVLKDTEDVRVLQLIILDCCRDDPFGDVTRSFKGLTRSMGQHRGLAVQTGGRNSLIAYAAAAGCVAYDGGKTDANSPFAAAILKHIATPGEDILKAFNRVRGTVREKTSKSQTGAPQPPQEPCYYAGIEAPEIFLASDPVEVHWLEIRRATDPEVFDRFAEAAPGHARSNDARVRAAFLRSERQDWERAARSTKAIEVKDFLAKYPDGAFQTPARALLNKLVAEENPVLDSFYHFIKGLSGLAMAFGAGILILIGVLLKNMGPVIAAAAYYWLTSQPQPKPPPFKPITTLPKLAPSFEHSSASDLYLKYWNKPAGYTLSPALQPTTPAPAPAPAPAPTPAQTSPYANLGLGTSAPRTDNGFLYVVCSMQRTDEDCKKIGCAWSGTTCNVAKP